MKEGIATEDRPHFQRKAHQLKGALYALNATHQAKIVEQLETIALVCPFPQLENLVKEVEKEVEALIPRVQRAHFDLQQGAEYPSLKLLSSRIERGFRKGFSWNLKKKFPIILHQVSSFSKINPIRETLLAKF